MKIESKFFADLLTRMYQARGIDTSEVLFYKRRTWTVSASSSGPMDTGVYYYVPMIKNPKPRPERPKTIIGRMFNTEYDWYNEEVEMDTEEYVSTSDILEYMIINKFPYHAY